MGICSFQEEIASFRRDRTQKKDIGLNDDGVGPYLAWDGRTRFKWSNVEPSENNLFSLSMTGSCIEIEGRAKVQQV